MADSDPTFVVSDEDNERMRKGLIWGALIGFFATVALLLFALHV